MISLGSIGRALRQFPYFLRNYSKALASIACPCRLDAGVQRQEVGLEGDVIDDLNNLFDLVRGILDPAHRDDGVR